RLAQAFALSRERGFHRPALQAALNRAQVKIFLNQIFAARQIINSVLADAEQIKDRTIQARADLLRRLAGTSSRVMAGGEPIRQKGQPQQDIEESLSDGEDEEIRFDKREIILGISALGFFEDYTILFFYHLGRQDMAAVADCLADCRKWFGESDSDLIRARMLVIEGITNYYEGRAHDNDKRKSQAQVKYKQSETELSEACDLLELIGLRSELWQAQRVLIWCRTRLGSDQSAIDQLRDRAENLLEQMVESLPQQAQGLFISNYWTFDEDDILAKVKEIEAVRRDLARRPWPLSFRRRWAMKKLLHDLLLRIDQHKGKLSKK